MEKRPEHQTTVSPSRKNSSAGKEDDAPFWEALRRRDDAYAGIFVYGVVTTGIYCRPGCPSRLPLRRNIRYFTSAKAAENAGFRPCRRCRPDETGHAIQSKGRRRAIEICRAIIHDEQEGDATPRPAGCATIAARLGISERLLRKTLRDVLDISPQALRQALRFARFRDQVSRPDTTVTTAMYAAGFSAPGRFYAHAAAALGMPPASYRQGGEGAEIAWCLRRTPLDFLLVATTERGIAHAALGDDPDTLLRELHQTFPKARIRRESVFARHCSDSLCRWLEGREDWPLLPVDIRTSVFQAKVFALLRNIPTGKTCHYSDLAARLGHPKGARAVARAVASNPVALAIPCHRVIPKNEKGGGYRWGIERKKCLLSLEKLPKTANTPKWGTQK